jgi:formate-dependent phosphoribosylglycinamide formyltransferase (GAR transformylase)
MIALLAPLLAQAAPVSVPPSVQHMADVNVLIGSCERHLPRHVVAEIDAVTRDAPENVQRAVREWREEGRRARAERPGLYTRGVCLRLFEAIGTY